MPYILPVAQRIEYIQRDFETAWTRLALLPDVPELKPGGGNFMFAYLAMILLEVACRLCKADAKGQLLKDFFDRLDQRDKRYFVELPAGIKRGPDFHGGEFTIPTNPRLAGPQLLPVLFDVIRNG